VNGVDNGGRTALVEACHGGPRKFALVEEIVPHRLEHNAQVDLSRAAATRPTGLIALILDRDVRPIYSPGDQGKTAQFHAAHNNRFAAVTLLVERGAVVNRSDAVGIAALHRTSGQCSDEVIKHLIDYGSNAY
jgi:ankyrin repeat protein